MMRRRRAGALKEQRLLAAFARDRFGRSLSGDTIANRVAHNQNARSGSSGLDSCECNPHGLIGPRFLMHHHPLWNRVDSFWLDTDRIGPIADGDQRIWNINRFVEMRSFEWMAVHCGE